MSPIVSEIEDVLVIEPRVFTDERGFFFESYSKHRFDAEIGADVDFVQDNHSRSEPWVLRGIHYQVAPHSQGKLVRVARGTVFDVAVDLRRSSSTFSEWVGVELSARNRRQLWIPPGFGHGFLALGDGAEVLYKTTDYYSPECERTIRWDDPAIGVEWPLRGTPVLSDKDAAAVGLDTAELFA